MRIAMGQRIEYASADKVAPLPWSSCAIGPMPYADKLESSSAKLLTADEDELIGWGVVFDEMLRAHKHYDLDLNDFLHSILAKGSKVGATVIGISQVDTSSAHGFTGADAQWREERVLVQAIHSKDAKGRRSPTGRYRVTDDGETVEWTLPEWMLTDLNSRGNPCPVQWMLNRFPELQARPQVPTPSPATAAPAWALAGQALSDPLSRSTDSALSDDRRAKRPTESTETLDSAYSVATDSALTQCLNSVGSQCPDEPYSVPDPATESIIRWLEKRGDDGATVGDVVAARLGPLKTMQAQDIRECLDLLVAEQIIEQVGKRYRLW
jgi:hypothetical protein